MNAIEKLCEDWAEEAADPDIARSLHYACLKHGPWFTIARIATRENSARTNPSARFP